MTRRAAVFLDRDGTLHRELPHAVREPSELECIAGASHALASLARAGFALVVISNQSAIARSELTFDELRAVNAALAERLSSDGGRIERFYVCPHHPREGYAPYRRSCACRKPASGLFLRAARELELDLRRSWIVGDALRDIEAGLAAGTRAIMVETGKGANERTKLGGLNSRVRVVPDIAAAAVEILRSQSR